MAVARSFCAVGSPRVFRGIHSPSQRQVILPPPVAFRANDVTGVVVGGQTAPSVADVWAVEVWSMPAAPCPIHTAGVVFGMPPRLGDLLTMHNADLHPAYITRAALVQYLQSQLVSRQAAKQLVQAIVLNGPYLPSQIDMMSDIADKLQLHTTCFISKHQLHVVISRQPALQTAAGDSSRSEQQQHPELSWIRLLSSELGANIQPLLEGRLQAARDAEQLLIEQLRLYSPVVWSSALQQKLLTRKRVQTVVAVRSLMSPASLASVRELVNKVGLFMLEVERELPVTGAAGSRSRRSSSSSSGASRRRIKPPGSAVTDSSTADSSSQAGCEKELVLVVSVLPFEAEDIAGLPEQIPPTAFTDYVPDYAAGSMVKSSRDRSAWWKLDIGKWFVRDSQAGSE